MRYKPQGTFVYTDGNGNQYELSNFESINQDQSIRKNIAMTNNIFAIAKREFQSESDWYKIFDANVVKIMENKFSTKGIKSLSIPE